MPIYVYECQACGFRFECSQRMADDPLTDCPECGGHVRRIIQPVGVIFRGSGFYVTDNRQVSSPTLKPPKDSDKDSDKPAKQEEGQAKTSTEPSTEQAPSGQGPKKDPAPSNPDPIRP
jgi:putative FmdB family regulatory protein